jgi:GNAT superfamily N-acetyltransferase
MEAPKSSTAAQSWTGPRSSGRRRPPPLTAHPCVPANIKSVTNLRAEHELRTPATAADWEEYHRIRRTVLWEARGHFGVYNATHPDEVAPRNLPLLLVFRGVAVGAARLDRQPDGRGVIRRMAIDTHLQRQGHGRTLLNLLEQRARGLGISILEVNLAEDAVTFYRKAGYAGSQGSNALQKCIGG